MQWTGDKCKEIKDVMNERDVIKHYKRMWHKIILLAILESKLIMSIIFLSNYP